MKNSLILFRSKLIYSVLIILGLLNHLQWLHHKFLKLPNKHSQHTDDIFVLSLTHFSGGVFLTLHMISPESKGLFHRGIAMSGTAVDMIVFDPPMSSRDNAIVLGDCVGKSPTPLIFYKCSLFCKPWVMVTITPANGFLLNLTKTQTILYSSY